MHTVWVGEGTAWRFYMEVSMRPEWTPVLLTPEPSWVPTDGRLYHVMKIRWVTYHGCFLGSGLQSQWSRGPWRNPHLEKEARETCHSSSARESGLVSWLDAGRVGRCEPSREPDRTSRPLRGHRGLLGEGNKSMISLSVRESFTYSMALHFQYLLINSFKMS